jgi:hypothetical protein
MTLAMEEWKSQTARFPLSHSHDYDDGIIPSTPAHMRYAF